jgi:hypothetical protein
MLKILILPFVAITLLLHSMVAVANDFRPVDCKCINQKIHDLTIDEGGDYDNFYNVDPQRSSCKSNYNSCSLAGGEKYSACLTSEFKDKVTSSHIDPYYPYSYDMHARMSCNDVKNVSKRAKLILSKLKIVEPSCDISGGAVVAFDYIERKFTILSRKNDNGCNTGTNHSFLAHDKKTKSNVLLNLRLSSVNDIDQGFSLYTFELSDNDEKKYMNTPIKYTVSSIKDVKPSNAIKVGGNKPVKASVSENGFTIDGHSLKGINPSQKPFVYSSGDLVGFIDAYDNSCSKIENKIIDGRSYEVCTEKKAVYVAKKFSQQIKTKINQVKSDIDFEYIEAAGVWVDRQNKGQVTVKEVCSQSLYNFERDDIIASMWFPGKVYTWAGNNIIQVVNVDQVREGLNKFTKETNPDKHTFVYVIRENEDKKLKLVELKPKADRWPKGKAASTPYKCEAPSPNKTDTPFRRFLKKSRGG